MKKLKTVPLFIALVIFLFAWDKFTDWLIPILKQSAVFHGLAVFAGIASMPYWLILTAPADQRPFPPDARFARLLTRVVLYSLSAGIALFGLSFWFPVLEAVSIGVMLLFVLAGGVYVYLLLRADKKQAAN